MDRLDRDALLYEEKMVGMSGENREALMLKVKQEVTEVFEYLRESSPARSKTSPIRGEYRRFKSFLSHHSQ